MRQFFASLILSALIGLTPPVFADDTATSQLIAEKGLAGAAASLLATPASPDRDMALAAVRFLSGIEAAYHARWRIGSVDSILPAPILRAKLPDNPQPDEFRADFMNSLADDLGAAMRATRNTLPKEDGAVVLRLGDIWLDVDGNGQRSPREGLLDLTGLGLADDKGNEIRFDSSDAEWLRAYTHLIEASTELVLAFDPEPALAQRIKLANELARQFNPTDEMLTPEGKTRSGVQSTAYDSFTVNLVDMVATIEQTLQNNPDQERIATAAGHLQEMIDSNRDFWKAVAKETDDDREWIPNDTQKSALGFDLPPGAGAVWLDVLEDFEAMLKGERLIRHWRFAPGYGIDLKKWITDPQPIEPIGWVQGIEAVPYTRKGTLIAPDSWSRFERMFGSDAGLYMVLFN